MQRARSRVLHQVRHPDPLWVAWGAMGFVVAFALTWMTVGIYTPHYDPTEQALSVLAQNHARHQHLMDGLFISAAGVLMGWSWYLGAVVRHRLLRQVVGVSAVATLGVAIVPLNGDTTLHAFFALMVYATMSLAPLMGAGLWHSRRGAIGSWLVGCVAAVSFGYAVIGQYGGAGQRLGLTIVQCWFATLMLVRARAASYERRAVSDAATG